MKGPYERLKYTMQRIWKCPDCQHRERTGGDTTSMVCHCQLTKPRTDQRCMKLIRDAVRRVDRHKV